jgi:hypothetical protein
MPLRFDFIQCGSVMENASFRMVTIHLPIGRDPRENRSGAMKGMERWKKQAAKDLKPSEKMILDAARSIRLQSLRHREGAKRSQSRKSRADCQSLAGCHHVMIAGTYEKALREEMMRIRINIIGPSDMSSPA